MRRFKQCPKITFLALGLFIISGYFACIFAEEQIKTYYPKESKDKCLSDFDINNVDFKDHRVFSDIPLLSEYFQCRAVIEDNIKECDKMNPWSDRVNTCRKYFNQYHGFYGRLLILGHISPSLLSICKDQLKNTTIDFCKLFMQGMLTNDASFCNKSSTRKESDICKAFITGDRSLCSDESCRNKVFYIKAVKAWDIKKCEEIEDSLARVMCRGLISMDYKICENNRGFKDFRNKYCEEVTKKYQKEDKDAEKK